MQGQRILPILASLFCLSLPAIAEEKAAAERIADDIQNLSHARFAVREAATRDLLQIGEPALKSLKAVVAGKDEEVRSRVETIVRAIETRVQNEALIRAPKLHLKYDAKPLDEAIADLAQKTGLPFILDPKSTKNPKHAMTLDTGSVPYWEAVERFLAVAGLVENAQPVNANGQPQQYMQPNPWGAMRGGRQRAAQPDNRIRLIDSKLPPAVSTDTLIRVKALPVVGTGGAVKGSNEINFVLDVMPAPALSWQGLLGVDVRKAIDERGTELAQSHVRNGTGAPILTDESFQAQGVFIQGAQGQVIVNGNVMAWSDEVMPNQGFNPRHLPVTLLGKETGSKTLRELHGIVSARVLTAPQTLLTVNNVMTAPTKETFTSGEYSIKIGERKIDKKGYAQLRFQLVSPAENNEVVWLGGLNQGLMQLDGGPAAPPSIVFQDAAGKNITNVSVNLVEQNFNGEAQTSDYLAVFRTGSTETARLVLTGRKSVCVEVPFVLRNVPLP